MKLYIGTKVVKARPMTRGDYNVYRGWTIPTDENPADDGYLTDDGSGHIQWQPKDVFEDGFAPFDGMDFGLAIAAVKQGYRVARSGWNGVGQFVYMVPANSFPAQTGVAKAHFGEGAMVPYRAYLALKTAQGDVATWAPSCSDTLAEDWEIIR